MPMGRHRYLRQLLEAAKPAARDPYAHGNPGGGSQYQRMLDDVAARAPQAVDQPSDLPRSLSRLLAIRRAWRAEPGLPQGFRAPED